MKTTLRSLAAELGHWTVPGGLLVGAALLWAALRPDSPLLRQIADGYLLLVLGAALLLAWRLRRSRVAGALLSIGAIVLAPSLSPPPGPEAWRLLWTVGAPLAWILLAMPRDRPVLSRRGVLAALPGIVVTVAALAVAVARPGLAAAISSSSLSVPAVPLDIGSGELLLLCAAAVLTWIAVRRRDPVTRGMAWSLVALEAALAAGPGDPRGDLFLLVAGLVLGVAVVEGSFALAYNDELTGLPGRRALGHALDRLGRTFTIAMVDVDHFKKFNDRHGHDVGDQVLRLVATRLRRVGGGGRAFRYGGEEFALVFAGTDPTEARPHLDAVRESIEEARFVLRGAGRKRAGPESRGRRRGGKAGRKGGGKTLSVTVSVGAAGPAGRSTDPADVLKRADEALYRAKSKGRNRVQT